MHARHPLRRQLYRRQRLRDPPLDIGGGHAQVFRAEGDLVFDPALHELCVGVLKHDPDALGYGGDVRLRGVSAEDEQPARPHAAPGAREIPAQQLGQHRFAAAACSRYGNPFPGFRAERYLLQRRLCPRLKAVADPLQIKGRGRHVRLFAPWPAANRRSSPLRANPSPISFVSSPQKTTPLKVRTTSAINSTPVPHFV
ncbi:hypothetical protein PAMA110636_23650 [Paenibacillus macerans]